MLVKINSEIHNFPTRRVFFGKLNEFILNLNYNDVDTVWPIEYFYNRCVTCV